MLLAIRTRTVTRIAVAALALALVALVWTFTPLSRLTNPEAVSAAMTAISASPWRLAMVLGVYVAAGLVFFPMLLLMIACAAVFGPLWGFVYSCVGLLASAALDYFIGAWLGREALLSALGPRFEATRSKLLRRALMTTAVVRVIPGSPFQVVSMVAGASGIRFLDYLIGSAIGTMVPVLVMSVATEQASHLLTEPNPTQVALLVGAIALWIGAAFAAQAVLERIAKGRAAR